MENENPISTLRDYSRPSHEGYQNTIELPNGNNVVPLRSDAICTEKAWSIIEELAQYEEEGWNDPIFAEEGSPNYGNASIEQILKLMESQVDSLMKNIILLIGKSENLCGISRDKVREFGVFDNDIHQGHYDTISRCSIHPGSVIDWAFLTTHGLARNFFDSINADAFILSHWANLFKWMNQSTVS
ncbi:hypothetical protein Tco_1269683 [Tanacetum coccineum]